MANGSRESEKHLEILKRFRHRSQLPTLLARVAARAAGWAPSLLAAPQGSRRDAVPQSCMLPAAEAASTNSHGRWLSVVGEKQGNCNGGLCNRAKKPL